ncbi:MAG: hypothetical protein ACJ78Q_02845 [Chloroflexia bacterium]
MSEFREFETPQREPEQRTPPVRVRPGLEPIPILDAADTINVEIEILKESYDEILRVIRDNEWDVDEGLRTLLLTGLGYQDGRLRLGGIESDGVDGKAARVDRLANDLAAYHSMYSVMKYKAFKLYKVNQVLDFNNSGLRAAERMWEGWAEVMRRQHADLQAEVERLRARLSEFEIDSLAAEADNAGDFSARTPADHSPASATAGTHGDTAVNSTPDAESGNKLSFIERVRRFFRSDS